ncbi:dihydrolipoyl dehydrogenase [Thioalkalivibrio sp. HK1]|uniref:dihydrolipoyl dehydrogenase n=1 Tax=Thioalkalivibrio sp. HK1 TaxID=1469245 RepID=UPI000472C72D|nr:dihydrolipoyl dehydrogenase [Thioalkalivibrio sp. HK1]
MQPEHFDVVVIGAGPGGYVAAIRAAQLGLSTACVDAWVDARGNPSPGGTCLNAGCIPSKALLDSSHHYHNLRHLLPAHGIDAKEITFDLARMQARKNKVVDTLTRGVKGLLRKNRVESITGLATLSQGKRIEVALHGGKGHRILEGKNVILATGSVPIHIEVAPVDGERIVDSEGALAFSTVPERLGIIGAGVIGLELGSVWSRLGSKVTIFESLPDFLPAADRKIASQALQSLTRQGLDIRLGSRVKRARAHSQGVSVDFDDHGGASALEFDRLIVAVGRRANTEGLDPAAAGVLLDEQGRIRTDADCRTDAEGIWAIGDATSGPMLAHKASDEGVAVVERIAGGVGHIDHRLVPWVIYTHPEIAWIGSSEADLTEAGVDFRSGSFPFLANGRALAAGETTGMVRMLSDAATDRILGVHILAANASELIAEASVAMAFDASAEDIARTVHAHPTLAEALHEAALACDNRTIHL